MATIRSVAFVDDLDGREIDLDDVHTAGRVLPRLRFDLTARQPQPRMILTLRPHGGLWLSVRARA